MKRKIRAYVAAIALVFSGQVNATVIQYFWGNTYNNPAMMNATKKLNVTLGALGVNLETNFWGTGASGVNGRSSSNTTDVLPYFNAAYRLNSKWVVGLNISEPVFADQNFGVNPVTLYDGTKATLNSADISPQVSFQATPELALGAGIDMVRFYNFQNNFVPFGVPAAGNTISKSTAWAAGWNAGLFYMITKRDYLSLYYYSKLTPVFRGSSYNNIAATSNYSLTGLPIASTTFVNYIRMLTDEWALSLKLSYSQWNDLNVIRMNNVATSGFLQFPVYASNTFAYTIFTKYQINPQYAVMGGVFRDSSAYKNNTRTLLYSSTRFVAVFLGANDQLTKNVLLQLVGAYGSFRNTPLINPLGFPTTGHLNLNAALVDFSIVYSV
ncbi:MAG TPA: outer membrane protein transport protein [Gammaproteobacteria bacterium]|jgi:long-chain fatty acid transport protein|nr:outer membrane protein transport protein [Gammaproteobacteria bacterium]